MFFVDRRYRVFEREFYSMDRRHREFEREFSPWTEDIECLIGSSFPRQKIWSV